MTRSLRSDVDWLSPAPIQEDDARLRHQGLEQPGCGSRRSTSLLCTTSIYCGSRLLRDVVLSLGISGYLLFDSPHCFGRFFLNSSPVKHVSHIKKHPEAYDGSKDLRSILWVWSRGLRHT